MFVRNIVSKYRVAGANVHDFYGLDTLEHPSTRPMTAAYQVLVLPILDWLTTWSYIDYFQLAYRRHNGCNVPSSPHL